MSYSAIHERMLGRLYEELSNFESGLSSLLGTDVNNLVNFVDGITDTFGGFARIRDVRFDDRGTTTLYMESRSYKYHLQQLKETVLDYEGDDVDEADRAHFDVHEAADGHCVVSVRMRIPEDVQDDHAKSNIRHIKLREHYTLRIEMYDPTKFEVPAIEVRKKGAAQSSPLESLGATTGRRSPLVFED